MAGFRQGLALLHPQGRNAVEDGADRSFLVPRGMGAVGVPIAQRWGGKARGRNFGPTVAARGKRRSRPLPTKAIDEAVRERGSGNRTQGYLANVDVRVQCRGDWRNPPNCQHGLAEPERTVCQRATKMLRRSEDRGWCQSES